MSDKILKTIKDTTEAIKENVIKILSSDTYKDYLQIMSKFHSYSFRNSILIFSQKPEATLVAGFQSWKKNFERHVMRGETGIKIIAPILSKKTVDDKIVKNDKTVSEDKDEILVNYRVVTVFDVSQTDGKELSKFGTELKGNIEEYDLFKKSLIKSSPAKINFEPMINNQAKGVYSRIDNEITIKDSLSEIHTVKTMVHEIAHATIHSNEDKITTSEQIEVEAESIAYTVCNYFNIDTSDYSFAYIGAWSKDKELSQLEKSLTTIQKTSHNLIEKINDSYKHLEQEKFNYLKGAEISEEGNYNSIDGIINNLPPAKEKTKEPPEKKSVLDSLNKNIQQIKEKEIIPKQQKTEERNL